MKLSEAIRLGSMLGPQAHGELTRRRLKYVFFGPVINEYCALGAAFVASGAKTVRRTYDADGESHGGVRGASRLTHKAGNAYLVVEHQWPVLWQETGCPLCPGQTWPLYRLIPHLNDDHYWTREQIADLVATLEQVATLEAMVQVQPPNVENPPQVKGGDRDSSVKSIAWF